MAATPESRVKKKIREFLKKQGVYFFFPIGGPYSAKGVPDIICCVRGGQFLGVEVKAPGRENTVTALQQQTITRINDAGGYAFVASSVEQVEAVFRTFGWFKDDASETNADVAR